MENYSLPKARTLAKELDVQGLIVFSFDSRHFQYTSYGVDKVKCEAMRKLADSIMDKIESGKLKIWG